MSALDRDERGATMVIGLFMAVLLVGMLYYVYGLGHAALFREQMQDTSDAAAFAGAVIHARGMNMLVLLNVLMAAVLAVVVALDACLFLLWGALAAAVGECPASAAACALVPVAMGGIHAVQLRIAESKPAILDVMHGARDLATAVEGEVPIAARAKIEQYADPVVPRPLAAARMITAGADLPVELDDSFHPCEVAAAKADPRVFEAMALWPGVPGWEGWEATVPFVTRSIGSTYCPGIVFGTPPSSFFVDRPMRAVRVIGSLQLGGDPFQVQTLGEGPVDFATADRGVGVLASFSDDSLAAAAAEAYPELEVRAGLTVSQAEFYFDDATDAADADRREWMWHPSWRARLRRFWPLAATPEVFPDMTGVLH